MSAAVIQTTPTEINFLADDQNKGFKVRVNSEREVAIFDLAKGLTGNQPIKTLSTT